MPDVPRLVPEIPFPAYTFVPGQTPHPVSDPAGHSFGREAEPVEALEPDAWQQNRSYLFALDLFNAGYYWEAHEEWEKLWHAAGRKGATADFVKALIHLAAAGVKHLEGRPKGVNSHASRAGELLRGVAGDPVAASKVYLGLRFTELIDLAERIEQDGWQENSPILQTQIVHH